MPKHTFKKKGPKKINLSRQKHSEKKRRLHYGRKNQKIDLIEDRSFVITKFTPSKCAP